MIKHLKNYLPTDVYCSLPWYTLRYLKAYMHRRILWENARDSDGALLTITSLGEMTKIELFLSIIGLPSEAKACNATVTVAGIFQQNLLMYMWTKVVNNS
jgi:hypothetical protein